MRTYHRMLILSGVAALALCAGACSSSVQTASALESTPKGGALPATQPKSAFDLASSEAPPKSDFSVDQNSRDPFFPKSRPVQQEIAGTAELAIDIPSLLQANLHGIVSAGGKSIAYISNVMLEEGRIAVIPIRAGGQVRNVNVRCREVAKDTVVLEVQGYTEPVSLTRSGH